MWIRDSVELFEGGRQRPDHAIVGRGAHRMGLAFGQQVQVGQLIRPIGVVVCIVAGGGIRLAARIGHALADSAAVRIGTRVGLSLIHICPDRGRPRRWWKGR